VLCSDCECVTRGLSDECLVCGSRSLLSLERLLGGSQILPQRPTGGEPAALLDVNIEISLNELEQRHLNSTIEAITNLLVPSLVHGQASFHIDVEPIIEAPVISPMEMEMFKAA